MYAFPKNTIQPSSANGQCSVQLLKEDKEAQKHAPQVIKDNINQGNASAKPSTNTRSFSTYARRPQLDMSSDPPASLDPQVFNLASMAESADTTEVSEEEVALTTTSSEIGHKFPLPTLPLPSNAHKDYRYDPVVRQVTNLLMQHGKLSVAQRNMSTILQHLRTASPPTYNPARPLLPGARTSIHLFFTSH